MKHKSLTKQRLHSRNVLPYRFTYLLFLVLAYVESSKTQSDSAGSQTPVSVRDACSGISESTLSPETDTTASEINTGPTPAVASREATPEVPGQVPTLSSVRSDSVSGSTAEDTSQGPTMFSVASTEGISEAPSASSVASTEATEDELGASLVPTPASTFVVRRTTESGYDNYDDYNDGEEDYSYYSDSCIPSAIVVPQMEGAIEWSSLDRPSGCHARISWVFLFPLDHVVTLKVETITIDGGYSLEIFSGLVLAETYTAENMHGHTFLVTDSNSASLNVRTTGDGDCSFNISYYAHPAEETPRQVEFDRAKITKSWVLFNCLNITVIPKVLRCDMVEQCLNGEDEQGCPYKEDGSCGDWVPYRDKCFKAEYIMIKSAIPGHPTPTMPLQAEERCQSEYGATLATLTDRGAEDLVQAMLTHSGFTNVVIGLRKTRPLSSRLRHLYRFTWQWGEKGGPIAHQQQHIQRGGILSDCAILSIFPSELQPIQCSLGFMPDGYVCMRQNPTRKTYNLKLPKLDLPEPVSNLDRIPTKRCLDGSHVQTFHRCVWGSFNLGILDREWPQASSTFDSLEGGVSVQSSRSQWSETGLPMFKCQFGQSVHYTLVCDGNDDCPDRSDELNCYKPLLPPLKDASFQCSNAQIIPSNLRCNGVPDCFDGSDEEDCVSCTYTVMCAGLGCLNNYYAQFTDSCPQVPVSAFEFAHTLPATLILDGTGMSRLVETAMCAPSEFQCSNGLCIPTFLVNNGEQDCPSGEDENIPQENVTCPGYYRCQDVGLCVRPDHVCDGVYHCPNKDDERYCSLTCPANCSCEGFAYTCSQMFDPFQHLNVRYLDLSRSPKLDLTDINVIEYVHFLNLSSCQLKTVILTDMRHLIILDLSRNLLEGIHSFLLVNLPQLNWLDMSGNPLVKTLDSTFSSLVSVAKLERLQTLIMRNTNIMSIQDGVLGSLPEMKELDLRGNQLDDFHQGVFLGLRSLDKVYADNHKICCSYFLPRQAECHAPQDELSSCSDLLRLDFFRVFLWTFSALAIVGNGGCLVYRLCCQKLRGVQQSSRILVSNLCVSDLLMGVYMMTIGAADAYFRSVYVSRENEWKHSAVCKMAGFLAFVSSEVSAFAICLVTLDRFLVLCFPLKSSLHLKSRSALMACAASWVIGVLLAAVPFMAQWDFYGQSGICLPLPITRQNYQGQDYAFAVFIVLNFVLFVLIGAGQVFIFHAVRSTGSKVGSERSKREMTVARRLFLVVLTDFLCWFPIGLVGLLASQGVPIPGEVNVWAVIFVLPLNSALNPFLYTINSLSERWAKRREENRMKRMIGKLHTLIPRWNEASVEELTRICIRSRLVRPELVVQWLGREQNAGTSGSASPEKVQIVDQPLSTNVSEFENLTSFTDVTK